MTTSLKWIPDGYNQSAEIGGMVIVFRPMTHHERKNLWSLAPDKNLLEKFLQSRIVLNSEKLDIRDLGLVDFRKALNLILRPGDKQEVEDARNLMAAVKLQRTQWGKYNTYDVCEHCQKCWFDPISGVTALQSGQPIPREGEELLCSIPGACPVGTPAKRNTFSPKNRLAYMHFQQCQAAESFPDDPIVKQNAELIRRAQNEAMNGDVFKPIL